MTRLDIIQALMVGAGISQYQAAKVLQEHDAEIKRTVLASKQRREDLAKHALQGLLCADGFSNPPETFAARAVRLADSLIAEIDK